MKVLNRPMFRMGGPIKEGIMSGIKEPRQGYKSAGMVFPADAMAMGAGVNVPNTILPNAAQVFQNVENQYGNQNPFIQPDNSLSEKEKMIKAYEPIAENLKKSGQIAEDIFSGQNFYIDDEGNKRSRVTGELITEISDINKKKAEIGMPENLSLNAGKENVIDKVIENKGKIEDPPTRKEKINTILEGLGYDRAQKNALYDAMIKAGQRISRTGLGADNLVSDVIAETSQSYDKPEKLREAANLMQVQQDLKLDQIKAGKDTEGTLEKNAKFLLESGVVDNSKDAVLAAQGKATEANDIFFEARQKLNSSQALDQTALTLGSRDKFGKGIVFKNKVPKKYKGEPIKKFLDSGAFRGDGLYTADGKIMLIQDGKIKSELIVKGSIEEGLFSFGEDD